MHLWPVSSFTGLDSVALLHTNNITFSCLVDSNPVELETSPTVILPLIVGVIWFMLLGL